MSRQTGGWEHFPHGADIGVRGFGATREEAFEQAALALTAVVTDPALVRPIARNEFACELFRDLDELSQMQAARSRLTSGEPDRRGTDASQHRVRRPDRVIAW